MNSIGKQVHTYITKCIGHHSVTTCRADTHMIQSNHDTYSSVIPPLAGNGRGTCANESDVRIYS